MLHERSMQERLAATKRMEALSVLAGGVAHDLNNALGPLVALPDVILAQLGMPRTEESVRDLRTDIETIKVAALRAAQTIKDLLTLGRQGRIAKENVDLNRVIKLCLANSSLRFAARTRHAQHGFDLATAPLIVRGSESQLARAVDNLIRNAVEAVAGNGEVVVKSAKVDVQEPRPPAVRNRSRGSLRDADRLRRRLRHRAPGPRHVFEPFFTKKRAGENRRARGSAWPSCTGWSKSTKASSTWRARLAWGTDDLPFIPLVDGLERREPVLAAPRGTARASSSSTTNRFSSGPGGVVETMGQRSARLCCSSVRRPPVSVDDGQAWVTSMACRSSNTSSVCSRLRRSSSWSGHAPTHRGGGRPGSRGS